MFNYTEEEFLERFDVSVISQFFGVGARRPADQGVRSTKIQMHQNSQRTVMVRKMKFIQMTGGNSENGSSKLVVLTQHRCVTLFYLFRVH